MMFHLLLPSEKEWGTLIHSNNSVVQKTTTNTQNWPSFINSSASCVLQLNTAVCKGVLLSAVFALISAPWLNKTPQMSKSPFMHTRCKGVMPTCVLALTSMSESCRSSSTTSLLRLRTAWWRALFSNESRSSGLAPECSRTWATAVELNLYRDN